MREFRIKVNNEKTYVVKAKDYNQAVKTLHSKLRDFDDTKKNINVVREFITNNGGKFSKSKDADAILDFIYKKTGVKNADYGDVLYIVRNYTNVKVEDNTVTDYDLTNFLALKRSLELRIGEEIDFDKLEEYVNKLPKDKNGKKNIDVKEVIKRCIKAKDNAVSDSISKYNGEDAIRTNGFVKIKEDGDWTSYKYNGSDFDNAVFKIHQYNPSLIAFVSNGNKTITVRNKYLNDADDTAQGEIEVLKSFGFDYKDGRWVKESNNNNIIVQPDYHYVSIIGPGDTEKHCKKYQYQSAGMLKKIIASNIKDSSIKDVSYVSGKNLKIGQKIVEDGEVLEVVDIKETQRGVNNNYRDVTFKNVKTGATETVHFVNSALVRLNDYSPKYNKGQKIQTSAGIFEIMGNDPVRADVHTNRIEYSYRLKTPNGTYTNIPDWQLEKLVELGRYKLIDSDIKDSDSYQVWTINEKGVYHKEADVPNPQLAKAIASQLKKQGRWVQISKNSRTNIVSDCNMMDSLSIKVKLNGKTYEGVFNGISNTDKTLGDVYIPELVSLHSGDKGVFNEDEGRYVSDGKFYFKLDNLKKWNPFLNNYLTDSDNNKKQQLKVELDKLDKEWDRLDNLGQPTEHITAEMEAIREELKKLEDCSTVMTKDADPVKVEKIIRKEKSALGITYYLFQTKSSSGYTIYYQVTDKTYHGEPTYSGGGIISLSLKSANDTLDHNLLADKLKAKYGEKEGTKRYLRGENDSAIKDSSSIKNRISYDDLKRTINKVMEEGNDKDVVNILIGQLAELKKDYETDINNSNLDKEETKRHYGEYKRLVNNYKNSQISKEYTRAVNSFLSAIKDSNNIKNRKSYTIKVGDKQYKVFAESESEAINKYLKSKKQ